jgi:nucleoid-associated protein YgaU
VSRAFLAILSVAILSLGGCYKEPRVPPPPPTIPPWEWTPTPVPPSAWTPTPEPTPTVPVLTYVIQDGDTLWSIAQQFGTTVEAIVTANDLENPDELPVGQEIFIPLSSTY